MPLISALSLKSCFKLTLLYKITALTRFDAQSSSGYRCAHPPMTARVVAPTVLHTAGRISEVSQRSEVGV